MRPWYQKLYKIFLEEAAKRQVPQALQSQYVRERVTYLSLIAYLDENERVQIQNIFFPSSSHSLEAHECKLKVCILASEDNLDTAWSSIELSRFDKLFMLRSRKELECENELLRGIFPLRSDLDITETCFKKIVQVFNSVRRT